MNKEESADLILKLYDLRREEVMRKARNWFSSFVPETPEDIFEVIDGEEEGAYFRMVVSYWDMAAGFVNHGAIDEDMFNDTNGEHIMVFSKVYPFIQDLREAWSLPNYLINLEKLILRMPDAHEMLRQRREAIKNWVESKKQMAKNA